MFDLQEWPGYRPLDAWNTAVADYLAQIEEMQHETV